MLRILGATGAVLVAISAVFLAANGAAQSSHEVHFEECGSSKRVTCVVDGDTIWFEGEKIRLKDFDTPEPQTNICGGSEEITLAHKASDRLVQLLNENAFSLERDGKDRHGRTLATIRINGRDIGDILIYDGLARSWPDGVEFWCE